MRRAKIFGLTVLAVLVLSTFASAPASAVTLPEFTVETNSTGTSGATKLNLAGAEIECASGADTLKTTSKQAGAFTIEFKSCELVGEECHSEPSSTEKSTAKSIPFPGIWRLVRAAAGKVLGLIDFHQTIKCKHGSTLIGLGVSGNHLLVAVTPILTTTKSFLIGVNTVLVGITKLQEWTEFENDGGTKTAVTLEGKIGAGALKQVTVESENNQITTELSTEIIRTT
jgi:hypothetical protein